MIYLVGLAIVILILLGLAQVARQGDRLASMTEEEFEAEAKRGPGVGNALMAMQGIIGGQDKVEYLLQEDKREEGDSSESGDKPSPPQPARS